MYSQCSHCFVRSDGWFDIGDSVFIAVEYQKLGDLQKYPTHPFDEYHGRQIATQVLEGLRFVHDHGVGHRDLEPGNIMVVVHSPQWFIKIADLGTISRRQEGMTSLRIMQQGTPGYLAPEAPGVPPSQRAAFYTSSVDRWSLGVMIHTHDQCHTLSEHCRLVQVHLGSIYLAYRPSRYKARLGDCPGLYSGATSTES